MEKSSRYKYFFLSIFIILSKPNPDSPSRRDLAKLFEENKTKYEKNVKEWCEKYAIKIPE